MYVVIPTPNRISFSLLYPTVSSVKLTVFPPIRVASDNEQITIDLDIAERSATLKATLDGKSHPDPPNTDSETGNPSSHATP